MIFKSKTKATFALLCMLLLSIYSLRNIRLTKSAPSEYENYTVEFEYYGMDAERMEKLISIPFEEIATKLDGLVSISSESEYSKSVTRLVFEKGKNSSYAALSAAADELKRTLPQDAQNPKIYALSQESKQFFCAAFDKDYFTYQELRGKLLKALQGIPGVSQAIVTGGERMEVHLAFDDKILAHYGLFPWELAAQAQESQARFLCENQAFYRAKLETLDQIQRLPCVEKCCAAIDSSQKKESLVRVNGKECILLSLKSSEENQNIAISKRARKILDKAFKNKKGWHIVYDNGKEQEKAIDKILIAFFETLTALVIAVWLAFRSIKKTFVALAFTAGDTLMTIALLSALKIPLDSATISGITISLGLICDAALYVLDDCKTSVAAIIICGLTTIAAILPLFALNEIVPGVKALARACGISIGLSCFLAIVFLPVYAPQKIKNKNCKTFLNLYKFSYIPSGKFMNLYYLLYIFPLILFIFIPKNLKSADTEPVTYAQVEYNVEKRFDLIDQDILAFLNNVKNWKEVKFVQSEAKRGHAEILVVLKNSKAKNKVAKQLVEEGKKLGGSLYVPLSPPKRKIVQKMQISILGDDSSLCQKLAKDAAEILQESFMAKAKSLVALNFKEGENILVAKPEKDFLKENKLTVQDFAHFLRWNLFGPVAIKIQANGVQKDVRLGNGNLAFNDKADLDSVKSLSFKSIPISALSTVQKAKRASKIFRKNLRRAASFTIEVETRNSGKMLKTAKSALKSLNLPEGYYLSWPKEYESMNENYARILGAFLLSAAAIFFLAAAQSEKIKEAFLVLGTIPLSLSLPLSLRALSFAPLTLGDAVGMVFVSGICVNNALYILEERKSSKNADAKAAAKKVLKSVLASSITTMVAAVPVMLSGAGAFASDLAFFMFFGSLASVYAGLVYFPAALEGTKKRPAKKQDALVKRE